MASAEQEVADGTLILPIDEPEDEQNGWVNVQCRPPRVARLQRLPRENP